MAEYSLATANQLNFGKDGNGVLLLISFKDRSARIEVGTKLEDDIPNTVAEEILNNSLVTQFREEKYYEGILQVLKEVQRTLNISIGAEKD
jgi:uncharacterized membrane protein YgcG